MRKFSGSIVWILSFCIALVAIYTASFGIVDEIYQRSLTVGVSLIVAILGSPLVSIYDTQKNNVKIIQWIIDLGLIFLMVLSIYWFASVYDELEGGLYSFLPNDLIVGCCGLFVIIEMTRRCYGFPLALFAVLAISYAIFGAELPWIFAHGGYDLESVLRTVWYSFDGVFGFIVIIVISLIFIFIIFGTILEATGAGATLLKISLSLTGALRGGPAHAAIAASGFFGTISGAVTANVVGTGVFTIPMIKARGFKSSFAGGVEAAASSGGQFMPPVMGAVAFVMADFTGIPYITIIVAALIPALFYYGSLFVAVWVEAARCGIKAIPKNEREKLTRDDWIKSLMFVVPVIVIIGVLATGRSPAAAGLWAAAAGVVMGFINPVVRKRPQVFIDAIAKGGEQCARIMVAVAAIGIIVGVMNLTGLGIRFSNMVLAFAGTNLFFALVLMALASLVLGMGLPTIPAYVIIVIVMGGAIEKLGVPKMLVHLFVVYYGVLSAITPPVAIAAYAAAPIAKSNPMATAIQAIKLSSVGFIIPFVLIYNPSLSLVYNFEVLPFISVLFRLSLAIWLFTTALGGVDREPLAGYSRVLRLILGVVILLDYIEIQAIGVILSLVLLYIEAKRAKGDRDLLPT